MSASAELLQLLCDADRATEKNQLVRNIFTIADLEQMEQEAGEDF